MKSILLSLFAFASTAIHTSLVAEEGMWPFNMIPTEHIQKEYGIKVDSAWIEHVQKSCLRLSAGGSGSFVSSRGLVMTNHHVGSSSIYQLSTGTSDLIKNGFYADSLEKELKCPHLYVDQLVSIRDVTDEVNQFSSLDTSSGDREKARLAAMAEIKKKAQDATGLQPEIVTLYQGARYNLYLYKRYSDVRLVMAPEVDIAFFGGDADNFEYPRYDLDVCFFRVYDNGKPLVPDHYLKWNASGPKGEEGLFVVGHPGKTERMLTSDHLQFVKDILIPLYLRCLDDKRKAVLEFMAINDEQKRIGTDEMFHIENSRKAFTGIADGFNTLPIIADKQKYEQSLYGSTESPKYKPWQDLKKALSEARGYYPSYWVLEGRGSRYCRLYDWAKYLVRAAEEKNKANGERLKEYTDTEIAVLEHSLFSTEPVYPQFEAVLMAQGLSRMVRILGEDNSIVKTVLAGKSPNERAAELINGSKLMDVNYRKQLYENPEALKNSTDSLIVFVKALDPSMRLARNQYRDQLEGVEKESYAEIAKIIFARYGESIYPDATFTLRMSMGKMKGYQEDGKAIEPLTTFDGLYKYAKAHDAKPPYALPSSWMATETAINKNTPLNFVLTNDVIGGNSGSPIINGKAEVVGLVFDGNMQSLIWDYKFTEIQGRSIGVHSRGILEALKSVYNYQPLVKEIQETSESKKESRGMFKGFFSKFF